MFPLSGLPRVLQERATFPQNVFYLRSRYLRQILYKALSLLWHGVMQMRVGAGVLDLSFHALAQQERAEELQSLVHKAVGSVRAADSACCLFSRNTFLIVI